MFVDPENKKIKLANQHKMVPLEYKPILLACSQKKTSNRYVCQKCHKARSELRLDVDVSRCVT